MKKSEIKLGEKYIAKVSNRLVIVIVQEIGKRSHSGNRKGGTYYTCINTETGRVVTFKSAGKFRRHVPK